MIIGIVAIADNFAIGKNGKLPWHYPADLKHFKATTIGNAVVMGAKTWQSIGHPLPDRLNIVLSRSAEATDLANVLLVRTKAGITSLRKYLKCDIFIIGGAKTYKSFQDEIEKWIVTRVPLAVEDADVFMPKDFLGQFVLKKRKDLGDGLNVEVFERGTD